MSKNEHIVFGKTKIEFRIDYKERKSMTIQVHPDRSVKILAPVDSPLEKVKTKIKKKAPWIIKQQDFFLSFYPLTPPRQYISGETHLYLGRQYRLKVVEQKEESVKLQGANIWVYTPSKNNRRQVEKLLKDWYTQKAHHHFTILFDQLKPTIEKYNTVKPFLVQRWMKKRWGSCSPQGKILLNTELIKAPKACIEYVLVHELCHLIYPNHSQKFFRLLTYQLPGWRKVKDRLERVMV